jgi:hypothetical protein
MIPHTAWDLEDRVLWTSLRRVTDAKYGAGWTWIVSEVSLGKKVAEVLKAAGPWWINATSPGECSFRSLVYFLINFNPYS